jgi:hypothetical protein
MGLLSARATRPGRFLWGAGSTLRTKQAERCRDALRQFKDVGGCGWWWVGLENGRPQCHRAIHPASPPSVLLTEWEPCRPPHWRTPRPSFVMLGGSTLAVRTQARPVAFQSTAAAVWGNAVPRAQRRGQVGTATAGWHRRRHWPPRG